MPAFGSYAPNTTFPSLASTGAPAHCAHGSRVTYSVHSVRRSVRSAASARWTARNSAWAVGSARTMDSLCARATTTPSRNTAAPTGTSPVDAARRASSSAATMPARSCEGIGRYGPFSFPPSPAFSRVLRTRRLGHSAGDALEREATAVLRSIHSHSVPLDVFPLEDG